MEGRKAAAAEPKRLLRHAAKTRREQKETSLDMQRISTVFQEAIRKGLKREKDWRKKYTLLTETSSSHG